MGSGRRGIKVPSGRRACVTVSSNFLETFEKLLFFGPAGIELCTYYVVAAAAICSKQKRAKILKHIHFFSSVDGGSFNRSCVSSMHVVT